MSFLHLVSATKRDDTERVKGVQSIITIDPQNPLME